MISTSAAYQAAIVGSPRRIEILAIVDLSDPDMVWGPVLSGPLAPWARPEQLHNKIFESGARYQTLERNRIILGQESKPFPDDYIVPDEAGTVSEQLSGSSGAFSSPYPYAEQQFSQVRILQSVTVFFSSDPNDGVPEDFTVDIYSGDTVYYSKTFTGNQDIQVGLEGFTVQQPTAVRVTCSKMSLPSRRFRVLEVLTGLYERWSSRMLASFTCTQQGDFSCLSLPYGSVTLSMNNKSRRFEPRRKDGIFQSIEERQGVDVYIGVRLPDGSYEHVRLGIFYFSGDGWKTGDNSLSMQWYLVDIIGLLSDRTFIPPSILPTTLGGWLEAIVSQLGERFTTRWSADPDYADKAVTANSLEDVTGKKCGDMIRWVCQASGTWPRADAETGNLCAEPLWSQGNKVTLANLVHYPTIKANQSLAALIFTLSNGRQYVVSGNSSTSEQTITVQNPFLHTEAQALTAARLILAQYGGNTLELTGRGDPAGEIGDVDTVWLDESTAAAARRKSQTLQFSGGVLRDCRSTLLQADGSYLWTNYAILTGSGTWTAPPGVTQLRLTLGGAGQGGGKGKNGYVAAFHDPVTGQFGNQVFSGYGAAGQDGQGGLVWFGLVDINPEQEFSYDCGEGGEPASEPGQPGSMGGVTTFGTWSSANGKIYPYGYTDIINGLSYARTGVAAPLDGSGDGGKGGKGGTPGAGYLEQGYRPDGTPSGFYYHKTKEPGPGKPGAAGASGFILVSWEKPGT